MIQGDTMISDNIRAFAAGILHKCKCKVHSDYKLLDLGLTGNNLNLLRETIENNYKIKLQDQEVNNWILLHDVISSVEAKLF